MFGATPFTKTQFLLFSTELYDTHQDTVAEPVLAQSPDLVPWPHPEVVALWVPDWHKGFKNGVLPVVVAHTGRIC